jgi:hypothetical protein
MGSTSVVAGAGGDGSSALGTNGAASIDLDPADVPAEGTYTLETLMQASIDMTYATIYLGTGMQTIPDTTFDGIFVTYLDPDAAPSGWNEISTTRYDRTVNLEGYHEVVDIDWGLLVLGWFKTQIECTLVAGEVVSAQARLIDVVDATYAETGAWNAWQEIEFGGIGGFVLDEVVLHIRSPNDTSGIIDNFGPVVTTIAPGDLNWDRVVNILDATIIIGNLGVSNPGRYNGDLNGDNAVDVGDLDIVKANWGNDYGPAEPSPGPVPEPATLGLLLIGGLAMLRRKR